MKINKTVSAALLVGFVILVGALFFAISRDTGHTPANKGKCTTYVNGPITATYCSTK